MSTVQKIIKYLALAFAIFIIVSIISGIIIGITGITGIINFSKSRDIRLESLEEITTNIKGTEIASLKIEVAYTNLEIKKGETFKAETNNKYIKCTQSKDEIIIKEKGSNWFSNMDSTDLILYIPENMLFDEVKIETGAGEINIDNLETNELDLEIGAGTVTVQKLKVLDKAKIDGGAGKVEILSGEINNLNLDMGAGKFALTSKLTGSNDIDEGVRKIRS